MRCIYSRKKRHDKFLLLLLLLYYPTFVNVNTFSRHHNALFLLNSRIPLVRFSSELVVSCAEAPKASSFRRPTVHELPRSQPDSLAFSPRSLHPTLRANPFPEVTDLFCRIPLSTLFYRPEAVHLGDLMRLLVRLGVKYLSLGFSGIVTNAPDIS